MKVLMMSLMVMVFSFGSGNEKDSNYEKNLKNYNIYSYFNFEEVEKKMLLVDTLDKKHVKYDIPFNSKSVIGGFVVYSNSNTTEVLKGFSVNFSSIENISNSIKSIGIYADGILLKTEYIVNNNAVFENLNIVINKNAKFEFYLEAKTTKYGKGEIGISMNGVTFKIKNMQLENKNTSAFSNSNYVKININPLSVVVSADKDYIQPKYNNENIINLAKFIINVGSTSSTSMDNGASLEMSIVNFSFDNNMPELNGIQLVDGNNNVIYDSDNIVYGLNVIDLKNTISNAPQGKKINFTLKGKINPKVKYKNFPRNIGLLNIQWKTSDEEEIYQSNFAYGYSNNS